MRFIFFILLYARDDADDDGLRQLLLSSCACSESSAITARRSHGHYHRRMAPLAHVAHVVGESPMRRLRVKKRVEPHRNVTKRRPVGQTWTAFAALYLSKARTTTANKIIKNKNKIGGGRKGPALNPALQVAMLVRPRKEKKGGKTETVLVTKKVCVFVFIFSFRLSPMRLVCVLRRAR